MSTSTSTDEQAAPDESRASLLPELVALLRDSRGELREEWVRRITRENLLGVMTPEEIFSEVTAVYDNYVDVLMSSSSSS